MKNLTLFVIKILVSALLIGFVVSKLDIALLKSYLTDFPWIYLGVAGLFIMGSLLVGGKRWAIILDVQRAPVPLRRLEHSMFIGFFFNQGLPSAIGGDVYRAYWLKQYVGPYQAITSVLLDRLYGMIGLLLMAMIALLMQMSHVHASFWSMILPVAAVLMMAVGGLVAIRRWGYLMKFPILTDLFKALTDFHVGFLTHVHILVWTALSHIIGIGAFFVLAHALQMPLTWGQALIVIPIVFIVGTIPISLAGWGLREGIMVYALGLYGYNAEKALILSVLYGLAQWIPAALGLMLWVTEQRARNNS